MRRERSSKTQGASCYLPLKPRRRMTNEHHKLKRKTMRLCNNEILTVVSLQESLFLVKGRGGKWIDCWHMTEPLAVAQFEATREREKERLGSREQEWREWVCGWLGRDKKGGQRDESAWWKENNRVIAACSFHCLESSRLDSGRVDSSVLESQSHSDWLWGLRQKWLAATGWKRTRKAIESTFPAPCCL